MATRDRERDRGARRPDAPYVCATCREWLVPHAYHHCPTKPTDRRMCNHCQTYYVRGTEHRCMRVELTPMAPPLDDDDAAIDADIEASVAQTPGSPLFSGKR